MNWLPFPSDFRAELRAAVETTDANARIDKLAALSIHRLDFIQTIQLGQALTRSLPTAVEGFLSARLAILNSSTVDHLVPAISVAGLRRRMLFTTYVAPYGQYRQVLLDTASSLYQNPLEFLLFSLTARDVVGGVPLSANETEVDALIRQALDDLRALWRIAQERLRTVVVQQTFLNVAEPLFGSHDRRVPGAPSTVIARLNDRLVEAAAADGVLIVDVARASERDGLDVWFDTARWLQGKMEIAPRMAPMYGELVARVIGAQRGLSKKCLVLDLDNTLWGGVIGDDGLEGIVLGEGSGAGEAHLALQHYAKQLHDRGVVLAVCSKNDASIAEAAFREHPEMLLKPSDIAVFVANWEDKASNLLQIAERLNIGIDSMVFVDDNPVERAHVRASLPIVAVPELPDDPARYVRCLADAGYFEAVAFTSEDARRGAQYAANASRDDLRARSSSLDEFLKTLDMRVVFGPFQTVDLQRIAQLIGKTNQFNLTTRRHSLQDVTTFAGAPHCMTLQFRLIDRYGDNGLVSVMILCPDPDDPQQLEIDTWVMSCRVFARQLELEAMNVAVETARTRGVRRFQARYTPTAKNGIVKDLYRELGFRQVPGPQPGDGSTLWHLDLDDYVPAATSFALQTTST
jgi:FkbH-like protein